MGLKKFSKITNKQIAANGVQALADRPNLSAQYGASGLSATQLKLWFDKLATFLAERINDISDAMSNDEAANYIRVGLEEYGIESLGDLLTTLSNGDFTKNILKVYPSALADELFPLQDVINDMAKSIAICTEAYAGGTNTYLELKGTVSNPATLEMLPGETWHGEGKNVALWVTDEDGTQTEIKSNQFIVVNGKKIKENGYRQVFCWIKTSKEHFSFIDESGNEYPSKEDSLSATILIGVKFEFKETSNQTARFMRISARNN